MLMRLASQKYDVVEGRLTVWSEPLNLDAGRVSEEKEKAIRDSSLGMYELHSNEIDIQAKEGRSIQGGGGFRLRRRADDGLEIVYLVFFLHAGETEVKLDDYKRILLRPLDEKGKPVPRARISLLYHDMYSALEVLLPDELNGQLPLLAYPGTRSQPAQFFASAGRSPHIIVVITPNDPPERVVFLTAT